MGSPKNEYIDNGDGTSWLVMSNGFKSLVDTDSIPKLSCYRWFAHKLDYNWYVHANTKKEGRRTTLSLHRYLLKPNRRFVCDHINMDTLDNRACNLRIATHSQKYTIS